MNLLERELHYPMGERLPAPGEAIEVARRNGKRLVVTVDDAGTGAGLLEALVARAAAARS